MDALGGQDARQRAFRALLGLWESTLNLYLAAVLEADFFLASHTLVLDHDMSVGTILVPEEAVDRRDRESTEVILSNYPVFQANVVDTDTDDSGSHEPNLTDIQVEVKREIRGSTCSSRNP